uniref:Uncharacterized protein n=1 Tax=Meloidogyne javanica TaxID=6303 RepID=A0A915N414_MELJA
MASRPLVSVYNEKTNKNSRDFKEMNRIGTEKRRNKKLKQTERTKNASQARWKKGVSDVPTVASSSNSIASSSGIVLPNSPSVDSPSLFTEDEQLVGDNQPEIYDACHDVAGPSNARGSMLDLSNMQHEELIEVAEALLEENIELNSENTTKALLGARWP